jgi:transposase
VDVLLPHLSGVLVERVEHADAGVVIWGRVRAAAGVCPSCGGQSGRVHSRYDRRLADDAVASQSTVLRLQVRRFFCATQDCPVRTFAEQVEGLTGKHARRTVLCQAALEHIGVALAGRAGERLGWVAGRNTLLRLVQALPDPEVGTVTVLGVDDFALRRGHRYATVLIDAVTHRRVDVLPDRTAATLTEWLRQHPDIQMVCRDGSATYAEAIRVGLPHAVQISDRWHLWHNLAAAVEKTVIAHSDCWNTTPQPADSALAARTHDRFAAVHALLEQGVGLLQCARRLGWALNTVKRYARATRAEDLLRPPRYGRCLVDPHRDLVRRRLAEQVRVTTILAEIREQGYTGSANLLVRYINQGRVDTERAAPSPRRLVKWLMSKPANLTDHHRQHLDELIASCPEMTTLAARVRKFAALLTQRGGADLDAWISDVRSEDLPALHTFTDGLDKDHEAAVAGLTYPHSNGPTEGVNTKIKVLKRQTYGRAGLLLAPQANPTQRLTPIPDP